MRTITVAYDGSYYTFKWLKVLLWARREFKQNGFKIQLLSLTSYFPPFTTEQNQLDLALKKTNLDIVFLAFHYSTSSIGQDLESRQAFLLNLKRRCNKIVWLDTADSTGNCLFDVMPYVDGYLKKQILRDRSLYCKKMYGDRLFSDYYHNNFSIDDPSIETNSNSLDESFINKLGVSWNIGICDYFRPTKKSLLHPCSIYFDNTKLVREKQSDLFFNGTLKYSSLIEYQRRKVCEFLHTDKKFIHKDPFLKMNHEEYVENMKKSKIAISPYGWGEVCLRDFEAFMYGAALLKPDMGHCETWPDVFVPYVSYLPIKWDMSNMEEIISNALADGKYKTIAEKGRSIYESFSTHQAKLSFVQHIIQELKDKKI